MTFQTFKEFFQCGAKIAADIAKANGVAPAQVQLWINQLGGAK